jgi:hypothetical protein
VSIAEKRTDYREAFADNESLSDFLGAMADFEQQFCKSMMNGTDFTLTLEIRGNKRKLIHCRVKSEDFRRPRSADEQQSPKGN